jgi:phospholipase C
MTVKTIIVCMLENRSFDHLLGWMSLPPFGNRADVDGLTGPLDGQRRVQRFEYENPAGGQLYAPQILERDVPLETDLPHGRDRVAAQMHRDPQSGHHAMNGFAQAYFEQFASRGGPPESMLMFPPNLIPATSFLARGYMVCDRWFCPIPTDTHPNRLMSLGGYTKIDSTSGKPPHHDRLLNDWCDQRRIRWRVYSNGFPFLAIVRPSTFLFHNSTFRNFDEFAKDFQTEPDSEFPQVVLIEPEFSDDPTVRRPNDNHPPLPMGPGEAFLADVYRAVTSNKQRWASTVLLVVYDEHGGYFDHVPPFPVTTSPPAGHEWRDPAAFTTSGPRVPAIIVSPLVGAASATRKRFDHTSILQFIAETFDPGGAPFSPEVERRRVEGRLDRIASVLSATPRGDVPVLPSLPAFTSVAFGGVREATTAGMQAFANARAALHREQPKEFASVQPETAFDVPLVAMP